MYPWIFTHLVDKNKCGLAKTSYFQLFIYCLQEDKEIIP